LFDAIVISEAAGVRKPDSRIFELTLGRLGLAPAEAIFVGDHPDTDPDTDIRGAQQAGIRAVWKREEYCGSCPHADATIAGLEELPDILDRCTA
jgi:putative hydrolase of the HAD superfamily